MAIRQIVLYADNEEALRRKSKPIKSISLAVRGLIQDLRDTLAHSADGIGLAAPQINAHKRVVLVRLGSGRPEGEEFAPPIALINPIIRRSDNPQRDFDGCLSFPGLYGETMRPHYLRVTGLDEQGRPFDRVFEGFDAVLVHHEIDHLDGVLFIDRADSVEDLYRIARDENGQLVRVQLAPGEDVRAALLQMSLE